MLSTIGLIRCAAVDTTGAFVRSNRVIQAQSMCLVEILARTADEARDIKIK